MAHFPTLEDAAAAACSHTEKEVLLVDKMLEALQQLKISEWCSVPCFLPCLCTA